MVQNETSNAHSSVERMTSQNTDEYCVCSLLERNESDDSLTYGNKVSRRSEKIDFREKNVGDNNESAHRGVSSARAALLLKYKKQRRLKRKCSFRLTVLIFNS